MRFALPALGVALLLGLIVLWVAFGGSGAPDVRVDPESPRVQFGADGQTELLVERAVLEEPEPPKQVRYRILDARSGRAIVGARLYEVGSSSLLATTGEDGFATTTEGRLNRLIVGADGYLMEHFFDRTNELDRMVAHYREHEFVEVRLEPDDLTARCDLRFERPDGALATAVEYRVTCLADEKPDARSVPSIRGEGVIEPGLAAAWRRHVLLSTIRSPDFNPELLHFGAQSESETFRCLDGIAPMRFVATGDYQVVARAGSDFCRQSFEVRALAGDPVVIRLRPGVHVTGQVLHATTRAPIADVHVRLRRDGGIVAMGSTGSDGRFDIGPVAPHRFEVELYNEAYESPRDLWARPADEQIFTMRPLAEHLVRGTVRRRPSGTPVVGAEVRLLSGDGVVAKVRVDDSGRFELRSYLLEPILQVAAPDFLTYEEMVNAGGSDPVLCDLLPATVTARIEAGLSAVVFGVVRDAKGQPSANRPVQLHPQQPPANEGLPGRRVVRGGQIPCQQLVITDQDGKFSAEWSRAEAIRVVAPKGQTDERDGHFMNVVLGQRHEVVLRDPR